MDVLTPARALLPAWTLWANLPVVVVLGLGLGLTATWVPTVFGLRAFKAAVDLHWTERARLSFPIRTRLSLAALATPLFGLMIGAFLFGGELSYVPPAVVGIGCAAGAFAGTLLVGWRRASVFRPCPVTFASYTRGVVVEWILRRPHALVLTLAIAGLPAAIQNGEVYLTAWSWVAAVVFAASGLLAGLPLLILLRVARRLDGARAARVREMAQRMDVRLRSAWVVPWPVANALALIYSGQIVFTERILELLDDEEFDAVTAHELGHVGEPLSAKIGRGTVVVALSLIMVATPWLSVLGWGGGAAVFLLVVVGALLVRRVARRMEERADRMAAEQSIDPLVYASALEKLYEANLIPAVTGSKHRAHPDLWDRMIAAGATPAYDKPAAPPKGASRLGLLAFVVVLVACACPLGTVSRAPLGYGASAAHWSIALGGGHEAALGLLGAIAQEEGRWQDGADLFVAAAYLSGYRDRQLVEATEALALAGDCDAAEGFAASALDRDLDRLDRDSMMAAVRGRCPHLRLELDGRGAPKQVPVPPAGGSGVTAP
jgi:Zn-dependent protease with chaperone function